MRYKLLGHTGLRVSELCLGTMTFGQEWGWGSDYTTSKAVFEKYAATGGNFLDTANRYTEGTSEGWLGDFIKADRDRFVVATKFSLYDVKGDANANGNHRKNIRRSVQASLDRLKTGYIDLLWLHIWDFTTSIEEIMRTLNDLIAEGIVHYIGISDSPAWIVSSANTLAMERGYEPFSALQVEYSLLQRTPERDLLPMARHFGMSVTPWAPLAGGALTGKYLSGDDAGRIKPESARRSERAHVIARKTLDIASRLSTTPARVALGWMLQRHPSIIPIIGARTPEQLEDSLGCLDMAIPEEMIRELEAATAIELGFPHDFLQSDGVLQNLYGGTYQSIDFGGRR